MSVLLLQYSVEYFIEHLSTQLIPETASNYKVVQNNWISGSLFKFEIS